MSQGGTVEEIESEAQDGQNTHEADMAVDGRKVELKVAANGSVISKESDDEKEEADEEGEDND